MAESAARDAVVLERVDELARLDAAATAVLDGSGRLVFVEAPAGFGKTTLLEHAGARLEPRLHRLTARGSEQERPFGFGIVGQLLGRVVGERAPAELFHDAAAATAQLFSGAAEQDVLPFQVLHGLYWLISEVSESRPLALLIDDAHEADEASLRFLAYLARRLDDLSVLVVVAARPEGQRGKRPMLDQLRDHAEQITLAPLSVDATAQLAEAIFAQPCDPAFAHACHAATGGNAFYLRELLRELASRGVTPTADRAAEADGLGPPAIVGSMLSRMPSLPVAALPLARACAVLGDGARLADCAALYGLDEPSATAAADALAGAGILAAGRRVGFAHPILRSAVLAEMGAHELALRHGRAAVLLRQVGASAQVIAAHLLQAEPDGDPATLATLRTAASESMARGAPVAAAELLRRALDEPTAVEVCADLLFELGIAEAMHGDSAALRDLLASVRATSDPLLRAQRAHVCADSAMLAGDFPLAVAVLDEALREPRGLPSDVLAGMHVTRHFAAGIHLGTVDQRAAARDVADQVRLVLHGPDGALRRRTSAYLAIDAARMGNRRDALRWIGQVVAAPGPLAFFPVHDTVVAVTLCVLTVVEEDEQFAALADAVLAEAGRRGDLLGFLIATSYRAWDLVRRGQLAAAESEARVAVGYAKAAGWGFGLRSVTANLVTALLEQGKYDEAAAALVRSEADCGDPQDMPGGTLLEARGRLRLAQGAYQDGLADLLSTGERMDRLDVLSPGMVGWRSGAAEAHLQLGEVERAQALAERDWQLAQRLCGPVGQARALRVLAATRSDTDDALALLEHAATLGGDRPSLEHARVLLALGRALRRSGRPKDAREPLASAVELATRGDAEPVALAALDELFAAGGRPRRIRRTGPESLTPAELRAARLAAQGHSNTAIAQLLFVSRKTIEKQLGSAYRKLGVSSRDELDTSLLERYIG